MNLIVLQNFFFESKHLKENSILANGIISQMKPTFCTKILHSRQGQLLGFHFLMPRLKMLSDVDGLRFSGTNVEILAPIVDIDSAPKLLVLLCLRSRT